MPREGSHYITIGIIGFGVVGRAIQFGFSGLADFRIHDIDPMMSRNTLKGVCKDSNYIFICVPTPTDIKTGEQDTSIVEKVIEDCIPIINNKPKILIIKSTLVPGTTEKLKKKYPNTRIVFNPEFLKEKTYRHDFINTSRVVLGGEIYDCEEVAELYRLIYPRASIPIFITDATSAETVKMLANAFLSIKVSVFNEFYDICNALDVDFDTIIDMVLADGRIGRSHTEVPGHDGDRGFGGKCFPKDLMALINKSEQLKVKPIVCKAAWKKNLKVRKKHDWEDIDGAVT